ncbi:hypothetical protein [Paenibacillus sp. FSL E2-0178]|uniref:hypothetical protein n=1 Tax=Paenibacillus sp. FSL E2-0178 TaxID=2921361 RepID=UPI003158E5E2
MKKRKWVVKCPACNEEEEVELDDEYTEEELYEKKMLIIDSKIISHCGSCRINGKRGL